MNIRDAAGSDPILRSYNSNQAVVISLAPRF